MSKETIMIWTMAEYGPEVNELSRLHNGFSQTYSQQTPSDTRESAGLSIAPLTVALKVPRDQGVSPEPRFCRAWFATHLIRRWSTVTHLLIRVSCGKTP